MKKYFYAKLIGYLELVSDDQSIVEWYLKNNTKVHHSGRVDRDGCPAMFGHVFAQSESEAREKVRRIVR